MQYNSKSDLVVMNLVHSAEKKNSSCLDSYVVLYCRNVDPNISPSFQYNAYGAACSEVELDVLTGEYQVSRVDIVYDCGER